MKFIVACMAVVGLGLWACGSGGGGDSQPTSSSSPGTWIPDGSIGFDTGPDFVDICMDGNAKMAAVYEDCGVTSYTDTDCSMYDTGYDVCTNADQIAESFIAYYDGWRCDTTTSMIEHDGSTITACTA